MIAVAYAGGFFSDVSGVRPIQRAHDRADHVWWLPARRVRSSSNLACPEQKLGSKRTSVFCSSRWMAKLCLKV